MTALLLSKFAQFREREEFIDVRLKVGEVVFPAHRNFLAANSDYFYALFTDGMKETNQEVIELKNEDVSADALRIVLDSIYSGDMLIRKENVFEVLATANHLQVTSVVQQCCDYLDKELIQRQFDVQTYRQLTALADLLGLKNLQEATQRHILKAGLDPGLWTLDSGLWFFSLKTLFPPPKKSSISPPPKKPLYPPEKPLYLHHETPPSPHKHFFPQI